MKVLSMAKHYGYLDVWLARAVCDHAKHGTRHYITGDYCKRCGSRVG